MTLLLYRVSRSGLRSLVALGCMALSCVPASASPIPPPGVATYVGEDLGAGPGDAHPNSTAAAASFLAAAAGLGSVSTITFEDAPTGAFGTLTVAPGVTISGTDYLGNAQTVMSSPSFPPAPSLGGFDTTPGGANYVNVLGGSLLFTFATPVNSFGAYIDGIQTAFYQDTITFSDGTTMTILVPGAGTTGSVGAVAFVGFTDQGQSISSIMINAGNAQQGADEIGVDDVQYGVARAAVTPEPESLILVLTGLGGVGAMYRRHGRGRAV